MVNQLWNWNKIDDNIQSGNSDGAQHMVFINTRVRGKLGDTWEENRIGLKCETVSITTSKTVPSLPVPGIGAVTGESTTLALDLGMTSKSISLGGIITDQFISKKFNQSNKNTNRANPIDTNPKVYMTAHEVAQLLHSSVDSSAFQRTQNLNELIILYPSRVNHEYKYHKGLNERTESDAGDPITSYTSTDDLPLIPFTYKVRSQDNEGSIYAMFPDTDAGGAYTNFAEPIHSNTEVEGLKGFVRNFNCTFDANSAFVTFSLDFEVALVVG